MPEAVLNETKTNLNRYYSIATQTENNSVKADEKIRSMYGSGVLFQEGTELVKNCSKMLDEAELQVKKVMTAPDGTPVLEDMSNE